MNEGARGTSDISQIKNVLSKMVTSTKLKSTAKNAIAYIAPILGIPITLLFISPSEYGFYAVYLALVIVIAPITTLRAEIIYPSITNYSKRLTFRRIALWSSFVFIFFILILTFIFTQFFSFKEYTAFLLPISILFQSLSQIRQGDAVLFKMPEKIIDSRFYQGLMLGIGQPIAVSQWSSFEALAIVDILSRIVFLLALIKIPYEKISSVENEDLYYLNASDYKELFLASIAVTMNGFASQFIIFFSALIYGSAISGAVGAAYRILSAPVRIVSQALQPYFLSEFATCLRNKQSTKEVIINYLKLTTIVGLPLYLIICFFIRIFFDKFIPDWIESIPFIFILAPMFLLSFIVVPISQSLPASGRSSIQLKWEIGRLGIMAIAGTLSLHIAAYYSIGILSGILVISYVMLAITIVKINK
ncbi:Polysaccharide biosynthesis protein [Nitrosomonas nitrosa]|jgi:O-antigen/teichoic acid export membrane protein|uniref:Polysaccharide biosynthesis protein n=1 Tax=Nitrosomonas nitrosa TaxID=52442 RepID=A0A1I4RYZ1_9PROT|nr:oligosaccharide flippase family protein [Nitrosomonas nitrosa]SFM57224.1 Polysaccharide biosynthesis protein [Nitrosomonas nitrosa]